MIEKDFILNNIKFFKEDIDGELFLTSKIQLKNTCQKRFFYEELSDLSNSEFESFKMDQKIIMTREIFSEIYDEVIVELLAMSQYNDAELQPELDEALTKLIRKLTLEGI